MPYSLPGNDSEQRTLRNNNCKNLAHNDLVKQLAHAPDDEGLWSEFIQRYDKHIQRTIFVMCKRMRYQGVAQAEDLAQEVYLKLKEKNGHRLKEFEGQHANSIFTYLETIAANVVRNAWRNDHAQKRPPAEKRKPLDQPIFSNSEGRSINLAEILPAENWDDEVKRLELEDAIGYCLKKILAEKRHAQRDKLLFKLYFYEDFSAEEIAQVRQIGLSDKRVYGLLKMLSEKVRECLRRQN